MPKKSNIKISAIAIIRLIVFLFIGIILFGIYTRTADYLTKDRLFNVKNILIDQSISFIDNKYLLSFKGQNIFKVDLQKVHARISHQYPQISQLRIVRQLPDTIKVLAKKREVLLQVQYQGKYLVVDSEAVTMFYSPTALQCPLVRGISLERSKVVLGAQTTVKEVNAVVELLQQLRLHPHTRKLQVLTIDVGNLSRIALTVKPNIQIIIDQEDLGAKVNMLEIILQNGKMNWSKVKYVDVRFKEPVINDHQPQ